MEVSRTVLLSYSFQSVRCRLWVLLKKGRLNKIKLNGHGESQLIKEKLFRLFGCDNLINKPYLYREKKHRVDS